MASTDDSEATYRVLVPVSDNEASARGQANFVAGLPAASSRVEVLLTHVLHGEELEASRDGRTAQRIGTVVHVRDTLRERGVEARVVEAEEVSRPVEAIVDLADHYAVDLIVLGGGMHGLLEDLLEGHVARSVGRRTDRPVAVVVPVATDEGHGGG
ncbi:universal stress protein [Haloarchaeobius baliensis]|uniref:universal stress protein n=1 Tax=Haloarchaeobius baliensis TaxID=1670458 RepID=UPI003F88403C